MWPVVNELMNLLHSRQACVIVVTKRVKLAKLQPDSETDMQSISADRKNQSISLVTHYLPVIVDCTGLSLHAVVLLLLLHTHVSELASSTSL